MNMLPQVVLNLCHAHSLSERIDEELSAAAGVSVTNNKKVRM